MQKKQRAKQMCLSVSQPVFCPFNAQRNSFHNGSLSTGMRGFENHESDPSKIYLFKTINTRYGPVRNIACKRLPQIHRVKSQAKQTSRIMVSKDRRFGFFSVLLPGS
jgi:hypothetical protein